MMTSSEEIIVGYDYDAWHGYGKKISVSISTSPKINRHTLICGMSGSGKSYLLNQYIARTYTCFKGEAVIYFADYKGEDSFEYLRKCSRYFAYEKTIEALDIVYEILQKRQSKEDKSRYNVTLVWDEYVANILALYDIEKKKAEVVMRKVATILQMGRSLNVTLYIACQRPDASQFKAGARINFGVVLIMGATLESIYSMLMPKELIEKVGEREFHIGEGVMLWQGAELKFIKIPMIRDEEKMKEICMEALT